MDTLLIIALAAYVVDDMFNDGRLIAERLKNLVR